MTVKKLWFVAGAGRRPGGDLAKAEPSHIHIPRTRRVRRPDAPADTATWGALIGDQAFGAPPADRSTEGTRA